MKSHCESSCCRADAETAIVVLPVALTATPRFRLCGTGAATSPQSAGMEADQGIKDFGTRWLCPIRHCFVYGKAPCSVPHFEYHPATSDRIKALKAIECKMNGKG